MFFSGNSWNNHCNDNTDRVSEIPYIPYTCRLPYMYEWLHEWSITEAPMQYILNYWFSVQGEPRDVFMNESRDARCIHMNSTDRDRSIAIYTCTLLSLICNAAVPKLISYNYAEEALSEVVSDVKITCLHVYNSDKITIQRLPNGQVLIALAGSIPNTSLKLSSPSGV